MERATSLYMKHKLLAGGEHSEKVSCEYYIFNGLESKELHVRWRQDIRMWVYKNIPTKLIAQLVFLGEAKVIYDSTMNEIDNDVTFLGDTFQSNANFKISDRYMKGE